MLRIPVDKVWVVIRMAREALGREPAEPPDHLDGDPLPSSEQYDEARFDAVFDYVDSLNGDELADLLALSWLGQADGSGDGWEMLRAAADDEVSDGDGVAEIVQDPTLPDDLEAGLESLGYELPDG